MKDTSVVNSGYDGEGHAQILDQVGVAVITIDADGQMVDTNLSAVVMFGYPEIAMLGENVSMLMPRHHAKQHDGYLQHHLDTGEKRIIGKGRLVEGRRADGSVFPMHLAVGRLNIADKVFFKGIIHDLSVQDQLQDQATRLGQIIDKSINEIFVFKSDTLKFTLVSQGAMNNLEFKIDEFFRMTPVDIKPQYSEKTFRELLAPLLSGELDRLTFQTTHRRKDGSEYDADIVLHLSDAVSPPEFVAIVQDSTEKNNMLKTISQAQKMESIGQLTGGIAHDFNNLLTIISGNLELLDMMLTDNQQRELVLEAKSASVRGADLTHRLLSFAKRNRLLPQKLNFNEIVNDISDLLQRSLSKDLAFISQLAPDLWDVQADRSQVDSALMNFAINARDAMVGKGTLTIATENQTLSAIQAEMLNLAAGNYAVLSVSDTGTGIKVKDLPRVFEPFFTTKSTSRGSGLGLSMVYSFAQQSGGSVSVKSIHGEGSSFSVYLPRDRSSEIDASSVSTVASDVSGLSCTFLLVEDDDSVRRVTKRRLEYMGHRVLEASDSAEAVAIMKSGEVFDVLMTDIVMPGKDDGLTLAKNLRADDSQIPIILSSGYSAKLLALEEHRRHEFHLLPKPYTMSELEATVLAAVEKCVED